MKGNLLKEDRILNRYLRPFLNGFVAWQDQWNTIVSRGTEPHLINQMRMVFGKDK